MKLREIFISFCIVVANARRPFSSAAVLDDMGNDLILGILCFHFSLMESVKFRISLFSLNSDNCSWSEWGPWSTCSSTCGSSVMKRVRAKDIGSCKKKFREYETERRNCPVDECQSDDGIKYF